MSSKRNHKIRSRKTYRNRMYGARRFMKGSMPRTLLDKLIDAMKERGITEEDVEEAVA